jgi:hypothetical protein
MDSPAIAILLLEWIQQAPCFSLVRSSNRHPAVSKTTWWILLLAFYKDIGNDCPSQNAKGDITCTLMASESASGLASKFLVVLGLLKLVLRFIVVSSFSSSGISCSLTPR